MYGIFYLFLAMSFLGVFLIILLNPGYRRVAFWTALACAPAGILGEIWLIPEYWNPRYVVPLLSDPFRFGLEDLILTAAFAGICAAVFEYSAGKRGFIPPPAVSARTVLAMGGYGLYGCILMVIGVHVLDLAAIHALFLSIFVILLVMARSSISCASVMIPPAAAITLCYIVYLIIIVCLFFPGGGGMFWNPENTWGIFLYSLPVEEMVWAFLTAMYCGIIYRIAATKPFPLGRRFWTDIYRKNCMPRTGAE